MAFLNNAWWARAGHRCLAMMIIAPVGALAQTPDWDVSSTGQPSRTVEFTVESGTWMSVDVSPDGKTLVFDLLGDIYRLPVEGGEAEPIHVGPAMQRSPSFSADGGRLLYLSDASGSENIWMSDIAGSNARQVTRETLDILTGPVWGPRADTVVASRTQANFPRMYGSELRLYDLAGGSGRVLVPAPANGRDVQEATFAADGRHVFYTERVTTPNIYVDANHANYVVKRRELTSGATEEIIGGFGGAIAPRVSPDGRRIGFVRRVKAKTVLFVYDVQTGRQRPVFDELERDIQADFVPHGAYYPRYGWFPDSRHVAIWGKGKLYRIDMDTGAHREIPFRVTSRHQVIEPVRTGFDLAPAQVDVRIARNLAPAPDGRSIVFTALGRLWSKPLPDGVPARLTRTSAFELDPVWAPDGSLMAYIEWDDERGSVLKVIGAKGRGARSLVASRGMLRQPSFSHDGARLTYRIQALDKALGGAGAKPGIYWVPLAGGEPRFVVEGSESPQFSPDGTRIYFVKRHYADRGMTLSLRSVDLDGHDAREHARTPDADTNELKLSPDASWLAFRDRQQYYVLPYRELGAPLQISAAIDSVPVAKLTALGGHVLTWSPDSREIHWALGPQLYRTRVDSRFAPSAALPEPATTLGLKVPADVPDGIVALTNARLVTMRAEEVIEHGTVVVERNRIAAIGPVDSVAVPPGAKVIDATGKTIMPGLIDMHGHLECCWGSGAVPQKQPARYAALAFGVTTNFDPYSSELTNYESTEMTLAGVTVGPRWLGSGQVIYGRSQKSDMTYVPITSLEDARAIMARKQALGGPIIKSYKQPARRQRQQLVKAGREAGIMVDVEGESNFYHNVTMLLDGHTNLEHNLPLANYYEDLVQLFAGSGVTNTPTLVVTFGELFGENYLYQTTRGWEDPKVRSYVHEVTSYYSPLAPLGDAPPHVRGMTSIHVADELWDIGFRSVARSVKKLDDAGVTINVGSHGEVAGLALHWEMWLLAQGGMSNHRLLRAATLNGARTLGVEAQLGSLEPGKLADLIVLDGNPLTDIRQSNTVRYTMINGRLYDSLSMNEIGNHERQRTRFYWELEDYRGIDWNAAWED